MDVMEKLMELLDNIYLPIMDGPNAIGEYTIPHKLKEEIADHLITNGVTVQEWISVKDRLPDTCVCVLVHYDDGNILVDAIGSDGDWIDECFSCGYITHWMPLPQPPKGE